jgi:lipopolysaccharide export system permease protein
MLKILDRYIIGKYLSTFFFVALIFTAISCAIDFSDKVEDFIEEPVTKLQILQEHYWNFILFINGMLWPIFAMIAVIFFTSRMASDCEMISILGAGVPYRRLLRPYLIASSIITALLLWGNHMLIPLGNKVRLDFEHKYIYKFSDKGKKENVHMFIGANIKAYIHSWSQSDSSMNQLRLERLEEGKVVWLMESNRATWKGRPDKWQLNGYELRTFDGNNEKLIVKASGTILDTTINLHPEDFTFFASEKDTYSTPQLLSIIGEKKQRGLGNTRAYEIELHRRTADAFTIIILTIMGFTIAGRKVRGGIGLHLAIGIGLGAVFIFLSRFSATFATSYQFPIMLGVWIPNLVFGAICAQLLRTAQK